MFCLLTTMNDAFVINMQFYSLDLSADVSVCFLKFSYELRILSNFFCVFF